MRTFTDPGSADALRCGSHHSHAEGHPSLHLMDRGAGWLGNDALTASLFDLARDDANPLRFGGPQYDQFVWAILVPEGQGRALARRFGEDRPAQLSFDKVVGFVFRSDGTGHMRVDQYRDRAEFERAVEHERALDREAEARSI